MFAPLPRLAAEIPFPGLTWQGPAKRTVQLSGVGLIRETVTRRVAFGATTFEIQDEQRVPLLAGTYSIDERGKLALVADPASLAQFLEAGIGEVLAAAGRVGTASLANPLARITASSKDDKKGWSLRLKLSSQALVHIQQTQPSASTFEAKLKSALDLSAVLPPRLEGTSWAGFGRSSISVEGFGSNHGAGEIEVDFGPAGSAPAGSACFLDVPGGIEICAPYVQVGTHVNLGGFAREFGDAIEAAVEIALGIDVDVATQSEDTHFDYKNCTSGSMSSDIEYLITGAQLRHELSASIKIRASFVRD